MAGPADINKWPFPEEIEETGLNTHDKTSLYFGGHYMGELSVTDLSYDVAADSLPRVTIQGFLFPKS